MLKLLRLTSEYVSLEDRFQVVGISEQETRISLWLTQSLLLKILPPLLKWVEKQTPAQFNAPPSNKQGNDMLLVFAHQAARAEFKGSPAVRSAPEDPSELVSSVDISRSDQGVRLVFKTAGSAVAGIVLDAGQLRQWLDIMQRQWQIARWPTKIWPPWLGNSEKSIGAENVNATH